MRESSYIDSYGRQYVVLLPSDVPDSEAYRGLPVGPPPLDELGLPVEITTRLHNELFVRRILTERDAQRHPGEIATALLAAMRLDAMRVVGLYHVLDSVPPPPEMV